MFRKISVLVDNNSWILPYAEQLVANFNNMGLESILCRAHDDVTNGDVCFMMGCTRIVKDEVLKKNRFNLVIHESDLPQGKGFAPVAWQIIEGKNKIPVCLIEACSEIDSGDIWLKDYIELDGSELCDEWRVLQGELSVKLALTFVFEFENLKPQRQTGNSTFYTQRTPKDSELNIDKSIREQFSLLRTVDNISYPAFFILDDNKYIVEIYRDE